MKHPHWCINHKYILTFTIKYNTLIYNCIVKQKIKHTLVSPICLERCANLQNFYAFHTILNPTLMKTTFGTLRTLH